MARSLASKPNVTAPGGDYPYGRIKDNSGINDGTPISEQVYGDFHQFFEKLIAEGGVAVNNLPENSTNGFQYFKALNNAVNLNVGSDIIKGLIGSYTTNDLIILWGCEISATIPGSSTITAGAIYYNGIIYHVPAATVVTSGSETLVFKINTSVDPNTIYLTDDVSGSGIANYNASTVKRKKGVIKDNTDVIISSVLKVNGVVQAASIGTGSTYAVKQNGMVYISGNLYISSTADISPGDNIVIELVINDNYQTHPDYYNGVGSATIGTCNIMSTGIGGHGVYAVGYVSTDGSIYNKINIVLGVEKLLQPDYIIFFTANYKARYELEIA